MENEFQALISFKYDSITNVVTAVYHPENRSIDNDNQIKLTDLYDAFKGQNWDAERIDALAAEEFVLACNNSNSSAPVFAEIAKIAHGSFEIVISEDALTASLSINPPTGGTPVSIADIRQELINKDIVYGVDEALFIQLVEQQSCPPTVIATGTPAEMSRPAYFISYIEGLEPYDPYDEDQTESHLELLSLKKLPFVQPGTKLMRLVPKFDGIDGIDVCGRFIEPKKYVDINYSNELTGIRFDEFDQNVLLAAIEGKPILHRLGMSVMPYNEINVDQLDNHYIEFEGALVVNGDLKPGMTVKVVGDVAVDGTIGHSTVEVSGSITTTGGIIGAAVSDEDDEKRVNIVSNGDIRARFIENANIKTSGAVYAENAIVSSNIISGDNVIVGKRGKIKGSILGGKIIAFESVISDSIGSEVGIETHIHVGIDLFVEDKKKALKKRFDEVNYEKVKLDKLMKVIFANPEKGANGISERVEKSRYSIIEKLEELRLQWFELENNSHGLKHAKVIFYDCLYNGSTISIGQKTMVIKNNLYNSNIYVDPMLELKIGALALNKIT